MFCYCDCIKMTPQHSGVKHPFTFVESVGQERGQSLTGRPVSAP